RRSFRGLRICRARRRIRGRRLRPEPASRTGPDRPPSHPENDMNFRTLLAGLAALALSASIPTGAFAAPDDAPKPTTKRTVKPEITRKPVTKPATKPAPLKTVKKPTEIKPAGEQPTTVKPDKIASPQPADTGAKPVPIKDGEVQRARVKPVPTLQPA